MVYTADTMGILRVWDVQKEAGGANERPIWRSSLRGELPHHRTRINDLVVGQDLVWTGNLPAYLSLFLRADGFELS